ncbi:MAG: hypothetical protein J6T70_09800 [Bacteroidales bacterium]|nr:hypothetical protein [Bacteroidales bacterium]
MADSRYLNPYTDFDITNAMNDAEMKGFGKGKEIGLEEGIEQGRAEGIAQGIAQGKAEGLDINLIAKITQLPLSEIERL